MSPETLLENNHEGIDGIVLDIWAFGVTLFCFVFMQLPFYHSDLEELMKKISNDEFYLKIFIIKIFN